MRNRLGEIAVGAELLPEADEHEGLDRAVEVAFHGVAVRCTWLHRPPAQLPAGVVAGQMAAMNAWLTPLIFIVKHPCSIAE